MNHPHTHMHPQESSRPGGPSTQLVRIMRFAFTLTFALAFAGAPPAEAQGRAGLWAGLVKTKGYVVGSPLASSGLHRFEGDTTWSHVGWNIPRISGVSFDPQDTNVIFLAAGNGALRTTDGGRSWKITTGWEVTESQDIAVDPRTPEHVYVATAYGVWRTRDRGENWVEATAELPEKYTQVVAVDHSQSGRVLIGTSGGLYVSDDGGESWELAGADDVPVYDIQQSKSKPDVWIAGTHDRGILLSGDGGLTWRYAGEVTDGRMILGVAVDPFDEANMAAAGWEGVFLSTDGGQTWEERSERLPVAESYEVVFDAAEPGRLWVATVENGIYYTDDFATAWHYAGLNGSLVFDMVFIDSTPK